MLKIDMSKNQQITSIKFYKNEKLIFTILIIINSTYIFSQIDYKNQSFNIGIESINEFRDFLLIKNDANYKSKWSH